MRVKAQRPTSARLSPSHFEPSPSHFDPQISYEEKNRLARLLRAEEMAWAGSLTGPSAEELTRRAAITSKAALTRRENASKQPSRRSARPKAPVAYNEDEPAPVLLPAFGTPASVAPLSLPPAFPRTGESHPCALSPFQPHAPLCLQVKKVVKKTEKAGGVKRQFETVAPGVQRAWRGDGDVRFRARIQLGADRVFLGTFTTEAEASDRYEEARRERDGF